MKPKYDEHHNFFDWFCPDDELPKRRFKCEYFLRSLEIYEQFDDEHTWDIKNVLSGAGDIFDVIRIWKPDGKLLIYISMEKIQ